MATSEHDLAGVTESSVGFWARCLCGWVCAPTATAQAAGTAHDTHVHDAARER